MSDDPTTTGIPGASGDPIPGSDNYPEYQPFQPSQPIPDDPSWNTLSHFETPDRTTCLTPRQLIALPIVANAPNLRQAARDAGIARATLYRWLDDPNFRDELDRLSAEAASLARAHFKNGMLRSFHILDELTEHPNPWVRHSASRTMALISLRITDGDELRNRIQDLEKLLAHTSDLLSQ